MNPRFLRCGAFCAILCVLAACALAGCISQTDPPAPAADVPEPVAIPASPLQEAVAGAYESAAEPYALQAEAWEAAGNANYAANAREYVSGSHELASFMRADTADALHAVTMARDYAELDRMHVANARRNAAQRSGAAKAAFEAEAEAWERSAQAWEAVADTYGGE